ncbi:helix-turn-helix transcriptional regulator [Diplocloster hominis]|uniref:helix-turn-helix transcriptional regulator n=1 Tax=Diplocloster hominis TaxID=3079010 RepID=UPI0031BB2395
MIFQKDKQFNVLPSHIGLRKYIQYYNLVFPEKDTFSPQYTLMPNACGTLSLAFDGFTIKAELWGATTMPIPLGAEPNGYRMLLLIQLSAYGLYQITGQNQSEFADKRLSLTELDIGLSAALRQAFLSSKTVRELVAACDKVLYRRMEHIIVSDALQSAAALISNSHGQIKMKEVVHQSCYSERQLGRLFLTQVGMSMKSYARLVRFNYVLEHIQTSPCFFANVSQQAGYFDQAHFDKDFKAITGVSPQKYMKTMSDFYYDGSEIYHIISSKEE